MNVYEAVTKRRSIRRYKDIAIPYEVLEKCVDAARLAPSAGNSQICEYIIVDDEKLLPEVFNCVMNWAGDLSPNRGALPGHRPKAYIIILMNAKQETEAGISRRIIAYDAGMAAENAILVALEQGLGACPILAFQHTELRKVLNIPEKYETTMMVALGYPDEISVPEVATDSVKFWVDSQGVRHVPKRKLEDITHRNRFPG
ncbi:MAG: nitroreductase family protein [Chloroflexi bacterium]|nr:nitroreductase family protein [Chloroflexota bacterium]